MNNLVASLVSRIFERPEPKITEKYDFIMRFEKSAQKSVIFTLNSCQDKELMQWKCIDYQKEDEILILFSFTEKVVIQQAEELKILKWKDKQSNKITEAQIDTLLKEKYVSGPHKNYLTFLKSKFLPQNSQIRKQEELSVFNSKKIDMFKDKQSGRLVFTPQEELRAKYNFIITYKGPLQNKNKNQGLAVGPLYCLMTLPQFKQLVPIHKSSKYSRYINTSLREYAGSNGQSYFSFVQFLQNWLYFPMLVGLITYIVNIVCDYGVNDSPADFIYALCIMTWSIIFITKWQKNQEWEKVKEISGYNDQWAQIQKMTIRKDKDSIRISPITGQQEKFVPLKKKFFYYTISILASSFILILSLIFIVLSLNARGFIQPNHKFLYSSYLSQMADDNGLFDAKTNWSLIPILIHVIVTNIFDQLVYRRVAKYLTRLQRHVDPKTYSNSIIMKYFIYEFIITFADLFYIAFVRFDIDGLKDQFTLLFIMDIVRRLVAESLIPWIKKKSFSSSLKRQSKVKQSDEAKLKYYAIVEVNKQDFEPFDDYLEIITNFSYLVMLSSCFPLSPIFIYFAHQIELIQDKYKSIHIFKRKLPEKYVGMGSWKGIIVFTCYFSIVTNIMLFAFSSEQIATLFPKLFQGGKDILYGNTDITTLFVGATGYFTTIMQSSAGMAYNSTGWEEYDANITAESANIPSINLPSGDFLPEPNTAPMNDSVESNTPPIGDFVPEPNIAPINNNPFSKFPPKHGQLNDQPFNIFFPQNNEIIDPPKSLATYKPPAKQHEVEYTLLLFILQHFFLITFVTLRYIISKQRTQAEIFLKRRQYKRRIKKNYRVKGISSIIGEMMVLKSSSILSQLFSKNQSSVVEEKKDDSKPLQLIEKHQKQE